MKKAIVLLLLMAVFTGCKSNSATNTKLDHKDQMALKGNWQVTAVTYPNSEYIKVTSFDIADSKCFVGSNWTLVSNNNKGSLELTNSACSLYSSNITWFLNKEGQFVMKVLDENKSKKVNQGYVLNVANVTESSFQLVDKINVSGTMTNVVYQFQRR